MCAKRKHIIHIPCHWPILCMYSCVCIFRSSSHSVLYVCSMQGRKLVYVCVCRCREGRRGGIAVEVWPVLPQSSLCTQCWWGPAISVQLSTSPLASCGPPHTVQLSLSLGYPCMLICDLWTLLFQLAMWVNCYMYTVHCVYCGCTYSGCTCTCTCKCKYMVHRVYIVHVHVHVHAYIVCTVGVHCTGTCTCVCTVDVDCTSCVHVCTVDVHVHCTHACVCTVGVAHSFLLRKDELCSGLAALLCLVPLAD